jgi:hypothetical protein
VLHEKSDINSAQPVVVRSNFNSRQEQNFPKELRYHELEESREFRELSRQSGYKKRMYPTKSKPRSSNRADRRQSRDYRDPEEQDTVEKYRPAEYRKKPKKYEEDDGRDTEAEYRQFQAQKAREPRGFVPLHQQAMPRYQEPLTEEDRYFKDYERDQFKPMRNKRGYNDDRDEPFRSKSRRSRSRLSRSRSRSRSRSNSYIGKGSHHAAESMSPARGGRGSPRKATMDTALQDFLNSKPQTTDKRGNPNQSGIGRSYRDTSKKSGSKKARYQEDYSMGQRDSYPRDNSGGGRDSYQPRDSYPRESFGREDYNRGDPRDYQRSPDRYDMASGRNSFNPRNMNHGGYNL